MQFELQALDAKINALLPPRYQNCYDAVPPVSMGSTGLIFGHDGNVAWDQMWTSFCDLALAGGPAHRGTLLEPVSPEEVHAAPVKYQEVVAEIGRGIWSVTELPVLLHVAPGWVGVRCASEAMASWLTRAIIVENVSVRQDGVFLHLPAGPTFRLEKETKNVITAMAKTYHYWAYHMSESGWSAATRDCTGELMAPALPDEARVAGQAYQNVVAALEGGIRQATGLASVPSPYLGWIAIPCCDVTMAVWLLRAVIVENVMVRREENLLFLPASPKFAEGNGVRTLVETFAHAYRLWQAFSA